jgi:hypothetical protein
LLRFLLATCCDFKKTKEALADNLTFRESTKDLEIDAEILEFVNSGQIYIYGRDHAFRPIIVFEPSKFDIKRMIEPEYFLKPFTYFFEYVLDKLLIPGQVENWIVLINLKGMSLWDIPYNSLGKIIKFSSGSYRSRLYRAYILNAPWSITIPWNFAKGMLNDMQKTKMNIEKSNYSKKMADHIRLDQLESKFGGTQPDIDPKVNIFAINSNLGRLAP